MTQRAVCEAKKNNEDPTFFIKVEMMMTVSNIKNRVLICCCTNMSLFCLLIGA